MASGEKAGHSIAAVHCLRLYSPSELFHPQTDPLIEERAIFVNGGCPVSGPAATIPIDDDNLITVFQLSGPPGRHTDVHTNTHRSI